MTFNINDFKKKIIYRSTYRGTKEMDYLLESFVKKYINEFNQEQLIDLLNLLKIDDDNLYKFNQGLPIVIKIENNLVSNLFKDFKYVRD